MDLMDSYTSTSGQEAQQQAMTLPPLHYHCYKGEDNVASNRLSVHSYYSVVFAYRLADRRPTIHLFIRLVSSGFAPVP